MHLFARSFLLAVIVGLTPVALFAQSIQVEAFSGEPFGVGRISIELRPTEREALGGLWPSVEDRDGRVFYPAFDQSRPVRRLLRQLIDAPSRIGINFLFTGNQPLEVDLHTSQSTSVRITPRPDERARQRLMLAWWREYSSGRLATTSSDYPPVVENYLTATLARRLDLPMPDRLQPSLERNQLKRAVDVLLGSESLRLELQKELLVAGSSRFEEATIPLPEELPSPAPDVSQLSDNDALSKVAIEPIAMHVPAECFYLRTGSFANFQWLRHRLADWGGDLRNLIVERGVDFGLNAKMERQLGLKESALAELLGPQVIADVAIIGLDTFQREGAALGILFQAKNNFALTADLTQQRRTAMKEVPGATEEKIEIAGKSATLIGSPDNQMRSFYVSDGDFHLVTTSRALATRFVEAGAGQRPLGALPEFQLARELYPTDRADSAFIFLSTALFENLAGAHYRIETTRRLQSAIELEMLQLARLAARAEGFASNDMHELVAAEFLPKGFGQRPDGSSIELTETGVADTLRGARGTFTPVPDIPVDKLTRSEARSYEAFSAAFQAEWQQMDPLLIAIRREPSDIEGMERVMIDADVSPLAPKRLAMLQQWLGPARSDRVAQAPDDLVSISASVSGSNPLSGKDHVLFGALREPDPRVRPALPLTLLLGLPSLQGYLGAWPGPGMLRLIGGASDIVPDAAGYSRLRTGIWRREFNGFTVMSLHPEVLEQVTPLLGFEPIDHPAQIWLTARDLSQSSLAGQINSYGYRQAERISLGNTALLNVLQQQLHVPADSTTTIAENVLNADLVCPLGGEYAPRADDPRPVNFLSTAVQSRTAQSDYQFPALNWLRGLRLDVLMEDARLAAHVDLLMPLSVRDQSRAPKRKTPSVVSPKPAAEAKTDRSVQPSRAEATTDTVDVEELPPPSRRTPPPPPRPAGK